MDTNSLGSLARISEKVSITQNEEYTASAFAYIEQGSIDVWLIFYNGTMETIVEPTGVTPTLNNGLYDYMYLDHYWTEEGRHPFFIRVDGKLAGFALVREIGTNRHNQVIYYELNFSRIRLFAGFHPMVGGVKKRRGRLD